MIALHRPGTSPLHRAPAGPKVAGLAVVVLAISLAPHTAWSIAAVLGATVVAFLVAGLGPLPWLAQVWQMKWLLAILGATQAIFLGAEIAWINTGRVAAVLLLAAVVTMTTPMGAMIEVLERAMAPLRRVGVDPARIAFTISLAIAVIPVLAGLWAQVRDAQRARGVRLGPRAIVALLVLALRHADDMGDALTARGVV